MKAKKAIRQMKATRKCTLIYGNEKKVVEVIGDPLVIKVPQLMPGPGLSKLQFINNIELHCHGQYPDRTWHYKEEEPHKV